MSLRYLLLGVFQKILGLFRKPKEKPEMPLEEMRWLSKKHFRQIVRRIKTSRGEINMPKFQRCPKCLGERKLQFKDKMRMGAWYHCTRDGNFYVAATGMPTLVPKSDIS